MVHFWLRHEVKLHEMRTAILPQHAKQLVDAGHQVSVEKSASRCVPAEDYSAVGCTLVEAETWTEAPDDAVILGLKELPEDIYLKHNHIYFGHCFKGQDGDDVLLRRFRKGGGKLWDLEFLTNENGRRVAAFGRAAGIVGMAIGLVTWAYQQINPESQAPVPPLLDAYNSYSDLTDFVGKLLDKAVEKSGKAKPKAIVIGALGRCGGGSCWFAESVGVETSKWDLEETKGGGPFVEILDHEVFINCIYLSSPVPPFITKELINDNSRDRKFVVMVDVSCDATNPNNPVPIYTTVGDFNAPASRVISPSKDNNNLPLDVVAIDHLPSMVPRESSHEFADALISHLLNYPNSDVWKRAGDLFVSKQKEVLDQ